MEITTVGPWILLVIGALLMLAAIYVAAVHQGKPSSLLLFGFLSIGVGIHGPLFMGQYADFWRAVLPITSESMDPKAYQDLFRRIGQGDFDTKLQDVALRYALDRPIQDMDRLLTEAIASATNDQGRSALERTKLAWAGKVKVANQLARQVESVPLDVEDLEIEAFDPATRTLVAEELLARLREELEQAPATSTRSLAEQQGLSLAQRLEQQGLSQKQLEQWGLPRAVAREAPIM